MNAACCLDMAKGELRRALARWKVLWDLNVDRQLRIDKELLGFYKNAWEYWWLAKMFLDKGMPTAGGDKDALGRDSMDQVNEFVKKFADMQIVN